MGLNEFGGAHAAYPPTRKTPGVSPGKKASDGPSVARPVAPRLWAAGRRAKEGECFGGFRGRNYRYPGV